MLLVFVEPNNVVRSWIIRPMSVCRRVVKSVVSLEEDPLASEQLQLQLPHATTEGESLPVVTVALVVVVVVVGLVVVVVGGMMTGVLQLVGAGRELVVCKAI